MEYLYSVLNALMRALWSLLSAAECRGIACYHRTTPLPSEDFENSRNVVDDLAGDAVAGTEQNYTVEFAMKSISCRFVLCVAEHKCECRKVSQVLLAASLFESSRTFCDRLSVLR